MAARHTVIKCWTGWLYFMGQWGLDITRRTKQSDDFHPQPMNHSSIPANTRKLRKHWRACSFLAEQSEHFSTRQVEVCITEDAFHTISCMGLPIWTDLPTGKRWWLWTEILSWHLFVSISTSALKHVMIVSSSIFKGKHEAQQLFHSAVEKCIHDHCVLQWPSY